MGRKRENTSRVTWRNGRARGDFRDFAAWGGGLEALVEAGEKFGTKDPDRAHELAAARLRELKARKAAGHTVNAQPLTDPLSMLGPFAAHHLMKKAERAGPRKVEGKTLELLEHHLRTAVDFFGASRPLTSIGVNDVTEYLQHVAETPGRRGRTLTSSTLQGYHSALGHMFERAVAEERIPGNPARKMLDKPRPERFEQDWFEVPDAALILEGARLFNPAWGGGARWVHPLVATLLLTGARESEALGLEVDDVDFTRKTIAIRPNRWRRVKNVASHRTVPLWPQLEAILRDYLDGPDAPTGALLFPANRRGHAEGMVQDWRKALDSAAGLAGFPPAAVRCRALRITYATARLQTLDAGAPVALWSVMREMGHGSPAMLQKVYGKLGTVRARKEAVEYNVEDWSGEVDGYAERLAATRQRAEEREAAHREAQAERKRAGGLARAAQRTG
jgi:integrase